MARFCKKTLLLLQKNALLILRRPVSDAAADNSYMSDHSSPSSCVQVWLVVELKVPLVLFVVMVVMRAKYPPERYTHKEGESGLY